MPFILPHNWCRATQIKRLIEHETIRFMSHFYRAKKVSGKKKRKNELH